jgi:hypothetical protein
VPGRGVASLHAALCADGRAGQPGAAGGAAADRRPAPALGLSPRTPALFDLLVGLLLDDSIADEQLRVRAWQEMPPERWAAAREQARQVLRPLDENHFEQLAARYTHLRRFAPALLAALCFHGVPATRPLLDAIALLCELNASGRRTLPDSAPTGFVPARWRPHIMECPRRRGRPPRSAVPPRW